MLNGTVLELDGAIFHKSGEQCNACSSVAGPSHWIETIVQNNKGNKRPSTFSDLHLISGFATWRELICK